MEITAVPQTPKHIKGVINLRGQVIPVIELRAKFDMDTTDVTEETRIIVAETSQNDRKFSTGIVVDRVQEVPAIAGENIEEAPADKDARKASPSAGKTNLRVSNKSEIYLSERENNE